MRRVTDAVRRARTMLISQIGEIARYACSPPSARSTSATSA